MNISANLKYLRNKNLFTQEDLADKLGIAKAKYGTYERGIHEPNIETIIKISQLYSISIDDLILKDLTNGDGIGLVKDIQNPSLDKEDSLADDIQNPSLDKEDSLADDLRKLLLDKETGIGNDSKKSFWSSGDAIRLIIHILNSFLGDKPEINLGTDNNDPRIKDLEFIIDLQKRHIARLEGDAK
ncbi:MAG: helix-turn-helix transcriptional regulator [Chitinophagales bacterium]|nr:helix-turn-helix transcriptional regulator [Chitinophagales bacterium]